jgi:hypothetical protein
MKTLVNSIILFLLLACIGGCKPYYLASDFNNRTAQHKVAAILPFEMLFTGKKPEKLSDDDVRIIEEAESKAFMISYYNRILASTRNGKKPIRIDIQHYDKTLSILKDNNIDIRSSWKESPDKLAKTLGVDAVVKAHIEKRRLMSDFASYGIDIGRHILGILTDYSAWMFLPSDVTRSKEVKTSYALIDKDGYTLWSIAYDEEADWHQSSNEIIDHVNHKAAKRFPYRQ